MTEHEKAVAALERISDRTGNTPDVKILRRYLEENTERKPFQSRVLDWVRECFGSGPADNPKERMARFFEEAAELVQAGGQTRAECILLIDYVYRRDPGLLEQEVGGVMTTLAALCGSFQLQMDDCGENELANIYRRIEEIRVKDARKPRNTPLPGTSHRRR